MNPVNQSDELVIVNGRIVTEDDVLEGWTITVRGDRIAEISPETHSRDRAQPGGDAPRAATILDAGGAYVMPGFIDVHADYIEHMAAPRPTSVMDFTLALRESERELITHGVTTMFHSLAIYDFTEFMPSPIRSPENTQKLISLIDTTHHRKHILRHRFHARFEIDNLSRVDELIAYIQDHKVHLISFMDHTPGQGQYRNLEVYRKTLKGYRNLTDAEVDNIIRDSQRREKLTIDSIRKIASLAAENSIAIASHDDDSLEKLSLVQSFGTSISEFPITLDVAREARRLGLHTVAGAPNILLGGSHSGNLSAAEAILDGSVDILCSDYYPAALLHGVFFMHQEHRLGLPEMTRLVTINPARAVMMDEDLGSLAVGKKADILIVDTINGGFPVVRAAIVDGRPVLETRYRE